MERTLSAVVAVFAAAVVLTGGCGGGSPAQAQPVITPAGKIVPDKGSGDLPEATAKVGLDCQTMLENRDFASAATKMDQVASADDSTDSEKAIAQICAAAAKANMRHYREALESIDAAKENLSDLPPEMRSLLSELRYHTELISAAAVGEYNRAQEALARLLELGHKLGDYVRDACAVASDPAALPECTTATPSATMTESPSGKPKTPVTSPPEDSTTRPTGDTTTPTGGASKSPNERKSVSPDVDDDGPAPS